MEWGLTAAMVSPQLLVGLALEDLRGELWRAYGEECTITLTEVHRTREEARQRAEEAVWNHPVHGKITGYGWADEMWLPSTRVWARTPSDLRHGYIAQGGISGRYARESTHYDWLALDFEVRKASTGEIIPHTVAAYYAAKCFDGYVKAYDDHVHADVRFAWARIQAQATEDEER